MWPLNQLSQTYVQEHDLYATAQETSAHSGGADTQSPSALDLIDAVQGDWNSDGVADVAALYRSRKTDHADLVIYERAGEGQTFVVHTIPSAFFVRSTGAITKQSDTSFAVHFGMFDRYLLWNQTLTIAYREGNYVVAGYAKSFQDGYDSSEDYFCEVNLRTGAFEFWNSASPDSTPPQISGIQDDFWFHVEDLNNLYQPSQWEPEICTQLIGATNSN